MSATLAVAIYVICWWLVWFAALPFAARERRPHLGEDAPLGLWRLAGITTLISAALFGVVYAVIEYKLLPLDAFPGS
jgi:predicted secreted protein